jgi:hypothetical protein
MKPMPSAAQAAAAASLLILAAGCARRGAAPSAPGAGGSLAIAGAARPPSGPAGGGARLEGGQVATADPGAAPMVDQDRAARLKVLRQMEDAQTVQTDELWKFYKLSEMARCAYEAGELEKARSYATDFLDRAPRYTGEYNYGMATHQSLITLGRVALKSGDSRRAREYLVAAARTGSETGSFRLRGFGPNMALAKEMLDQGQREPVLEYFTLCADFWEGGRERLATWSTDVKQGKQPEFGANLLY